MASVEGVDRVAAVFRRISRGAAEKIAQALERGGDEIAARARSIAPVDEGDLRETIARRTNIRTTQRQDGSARGVVVYVVAGDTKETAHAAYRQEFGRAAGGTGERNANHPGHPAQPFLFPAYWSLRRRVRSRVARAINAAVKEAAARGR
jgi:HK97 gp10 family phage protein